MITRQASCRLLLARPSLRVFTFVLINGLLLGAIACSARRTATTTTSGDGTTTGTDTTGTTSTTGTDTTTTTTSSTPTNQLFDTDLDDSEKAYGNQIQNYPASTSSEQSCLANGYSNTFNQGQTYTGSQYSSTANNACLSPQQTGAQYQLSADTFYQAGVAAYTDINQCLSMVLQHQPQTQDSAMTAHVAGRMALVRCYQQQVLSGMQNSLPWGEDATRNFQFQNSNLGILLVLLSVQN